MLALREERLRAQQGPDIARGEPDEGLFEGRRGCGRRGGLDERLALVEYEPARCGGVDDGVEEGLGGAQPGEAVEGAAAKEIDVAGSERGSAGEDGCVCRGRVCLRL